MTEHQESDDMDFGPSADLAMALLAIFICALALLIQHRHKIETDLDNQTQATQTVTAQLGDTADKLDATQKSFDGVTKENHEKGVRIAGLVEGLALANQNLKRVRGQVSEVTDKLDDVQRQHRDLERKVNDRDRLIGTQETMLGQKTKEIEKLTDQIGDVQLRDLDGHRLVVELQTVNCPSDCDLDIWLQDPTDFVCSWMNPKVSDDSGVIAGLRKSEDLLFPVGVQREVYYSKKARFEASKPYVIGGMLWRDSTDQKYVGTLVRWTIRLRTSSGRIEKKTGTARISMTGTVTAAGRRVYATYTFVGFHIRSDGIEIVPAPSRFRGWTTTTRQADEKLFRKNR